MYKQTNSAIEIYTDVKYQFKVCFLLLTGQFWKITKYYVHKYSTNLYCAKLMTINHTLFGKDVRPTHK